MSGANHAGGSAFRRGFVAEKILRLLQGLPVSLPAALAAFSTVAIMHLLIGEFSVRLVLPLGGIAAIAAGYYAHRLYLLGSGENVRRRRVFDILVLIGIVCWVGFNIIFSSQHIFTNRDPATYNLGGIWLITHDDIRIEKPAALESLAVEGLESESLGFLTNPNDESEILAQGAHLLPALQGLVGKVFGIEGVLRANALFGAFALLAFYGFSRLLVRPQWAALGTLIMALSLPMIFMTRDSYTEPLSMTFLFGGLSLLMYAQKRRDPWQWWLAGLVLGAAALTRIDAYITFAGILLFVVVLLMTTAPLQRRQTFVAAAWLAVGMMLGSYLAWLDVSTLSVAYYQAHAQFILPQLYLLAGIAASGVILVTLNWRFNTLGILDRFTRSWRDRTLLIGISAFFLILVSRPIWFIGYQENSEGTQVRTFSEQTMNWIIWYIGPVTVVAGVIGLALIVNRLLKGRDLLLLPFILALSVTALLYLLKPSITGDQVWATRRLLPIVIPGIVLLGMWALQRLFAQKTITLRGRTYSAEIISVVLITLSVVSPLFVTYPFTFRRLYIPELKQIRAVCAAAPKEAIIIWLGESRYFATQPTRTVCGNQSLGLSSFSPIDTEAKLNLIAIRAEQTNQKVMLGFYASDTTPVPKTILDRAKVVSDETYNEIEHTYKRAPRNVITIERKIYMSPLTPPVK